MKSLKLVTIDEIQKHYHDFVLPRNGYQKGGWLGYLKQYLQHNSDVFNLIVVHPLKTFQSIKK